jgi:predicted porin
METAMRKSKILMAAVLPLLATTAYAQVTIYGILDIGPTYITNQGGRSNTRIDSGTLQQSRIGFKGTEDLGDGYSAFFALENGFNLDDGSMATANNLFSRDSRLGLKGGFGTVSLGRQSNATVDALAPFASSMLAYGPSYLSVHPGNYDRLLNVPTDNSIKYASPVFGGLSAVGFYAFGEQAGDSKQNSTRNVSLSYANGPLTLGASYLWTSGSNITSTAFLGTASNPFGATGTSDVLSSAGAGASYKFDSLLVHGNVTQSSFGLANTTGRTYEIGSKISVSSAVTLGIDLSHTTVADRARLNTLALSAVYSLSKRTDVYVVAASENVSGTNSTGTPLTAQLFTLPASSTSRQTALQMGIRHSF